MPLQQYVTRYDHDQLGLSTIHLAVIDPAQSSRPNADQWIPAYRDMMGDQPVVWIRSPLLDGDLWIKDQAGERKAKRWS
jgi:hypothetical protein